MSTSQVGWANASLRYPEELPQLPAPGKGVVREDPLDAGFSPGVSLRVGAGSSHHSDQLPGGALTAEHSGPGSLERAGSVGSGPAEMEVVTGPAPPRQSLEVQAAQVEVVRESYAHVRALSVTRT